MVPTGTATVLRVFLASPGDVAEERAFVRTYLESVLPKSPLLRGRAVRFDVIAWDDPHAPTSMPAHMTPQEAVIAAKGRPSDCHIVIVILASRLGTHLSLDTFRRTDGSAYRSGTEWEYEDAWDASPRPEIRVYRRTDLPPIQTSDLERRKKLDQLDLVDSFFERFTNPDGSARGGYQPYTGIEDFRTKLTHDLQTILADQVALAPGPVPPPPAEQDTTNVPLPPRCLGRDDDLSRIVGALKSGTTPTAILVRGPGGIGKTTLTQQAAHDPAVIDRFGQRRWFAELETAVDRDSFDAQLLLGMGLDPTQGFAAALRRLGQAPALLVLDNLETAWDAAGPAIEARIGDLATVPGIALLASIRGERPVGGTRWLPHRLTPLSDPDARALFCAIADTIPDSDPNLPELLKELGGVPLAVCLTARQAAGQTDLSALWAAWQRLGSGMAVWGGVAEDHLTSVPHSIALSLNAPGLGDAGKRLFAILGQCPAGLSPWDRDALLGDAAFAADRDLRAVGLLHPNGARQDLLPPVRDYARRVCKPAGEDVAGWCRHFLTRVRVEGGKIFGTGGAEALLALTPEVPNIDAALRAAPRLDLRTEAVAALNGVYRLLSASGAGSAAALDTLAAACRQQKDPGGEAVIHYSYAVINLNRSDHDTARDRYQEALPLFQQVGDVLGEANCIQSLGHIALQRSDHDTARDRYQQALPLHQQVGDVLGEANCLQSLGDIALRRSDHDTARHRYQQALPLHQQVGDVLGGANCIQRLGDIALRRSDHDTARHRYLQVLPLFQQVGDVLGEANCIKSLGDIALRRSDHDTARDRYQQALSLYQQVGDIHGEANCIQSLGDIALRRSDHDTARDRYQQALPLYQQVGDVLGEASCIKSLGDIARRHSDHDTARDQYLQALPLYRQVGDILGEANCVLGLGRVAREMGEEITARAQAAEALAMYERMHNLGNAALAHEDLARVTTGEERSAHVEAAKAAWRSMNLPDEVARVERDFGSG